MMVTSMVSPIFEPQLHPKVTRSCWQSHRGTPGGTSGSSHRRFCDVEKRQTGGAELEKRHGKICELVISNGYHDIPMLMPWTNTILAIYIIIYTYSIGYPCWLVEFSFLVIYPILRTLIHQNFTSQDLRFDQLLSGTNVGIYLDKWW